ncbi:hypothetical protein MRX96_033970 [Rhipicephalus microplus]
MSSSGEAKTSGTDNLISGSGRMMAHAHWRHGAYRLDKRQQHVAESGGDHLHWETSVLEDSVVAQPPSQQIGRDVFCSFIVGELDSVLFDAEYHDGWSIH